MSARYADVVAHLYVYGPSAGRPLGGGLSDADRRRLRERDRRLAEAELGLWSESPLAGTRQPLMESALTATPQRVRAQTLYSAARALLAVALRALSTPA